ncbi:MAG: hypothetical protein K2X82_19710 [Gemmataceae bacterium]|nr:hypothetical protein [Gemmataceae bacterium]
MVAGNLSVVLYGALVVGFGHVPGRPPLAPPPYPSLNEVVREYKRLGLPLPPRDAPLVRIPLWRRSGDDTDGPRLTYLLAFRLPPPWPGADPRYWVGANEFWAEQWFDPWTVESAEPTLDALRLVSMGDEQCLDMAVACRLRGWGEVANRLYAHARKLRYFRAEESGDPKEEYPIFEELRDRAFYLWYGRLTSRNSDSDGADRHLRKLIDDKEGPWAAAAGWLTSRLKVIAPRRAAPAGTIEALIDGLTEYRDDPYGPPDPAGKEPYWRLAERGFDAVPALIAHLRDDRTSRAIFPGFNNFRPYTLTIGHLCSRLLYDLSGETIGGGYFDLRGDRLNPDEARKWFAAAKEVGEERWLLEHVLPKKDRGPLGRTEQLAARVLGAKYPARLPAVYRAVLAKPPTFLIGDLIEEVLASKLTREQKVALFEEGAGHDDIGHRVFALRGLAEVDPPRFRKLLAATLHWLRDGQAVCLWFNDPYEVFPLVERSGDPACWDALADLARAGSFDLRMSLLSTAGRLDPPDRPDPVRRERVRLLAGLLDDRTAEAHEVDDWNWTEVRDHAAAQLAGVLRLPVRRDGEFVRADQELGPLSRLLFREVVRAATERELARPAKR